MGTIPPVLFEKQKQSALAPDGLPWPPGYFDCTPRMIFEVALNEFGVRPNHYWMGWPIYTFRERANPSFTNPESEVRPELDAERIVRWEESKVSKLAPDGLHWPPGYFARKPRMIFEAALTEYGVRPNHYLNGWPVYTEAETTRPEFRCALSESSPEENEYWNAQFEKFKICENLATD